MIDTLTRCLPFAAPALRYSDNPNRPMWRLDLLAYTIVVWVLDMVLAHLFFSPQRGEWTFSTRGNRLQYDSGWRGRVGRLVKDYTNFFDPQHDHA